MEEIQSWLDNTHTSSLSKSPSFSSSGSTSTSHETYSTPTLCEDTSFNSLESTKHNYSHNKNYSLIPKPYISHFCITTLKTLTPQICCLAVHSNNLYAATIKEINVYDLTSYDLLDTFGSGSGSGLVKSIAFSDKKIFTAHQDCKIRVWKQVMIKSSCKQKHELISTLPTLKDRLYNCMLPKNYVQVRRHKHKLWIDHADVVSRLAVNNDVGLMCSVSWDKSFKTWKTSSDNMHCLESIKAHNDAVNAVVINPFDNTIYTGSADGEIKVWRKSGDSKKHLSIATLAEHESSVNALALMNDGSVLWSGGGDKIIHVWEKGDNCENYMFVSCSLRGHRGAILSLVHVNGVVISGSSDKTLRIWKYGKDLGGCLAILEGHCKPVKSIVAISEGDLDNNLVVFSGSLDGEIRVWKVVISDDRD